MTLHEKVFVKIREYCGLEGTYKISTFIDIGAQTNRHNNKSMGEQEQRNETLMLDYR